ncbi:reverse transcriptase domain-containing protein [Tanacetum coccineum]
MERTMKRYGVNHHFSIAYHPQTSGQVKNTNRSLKRILEKTVKDNPAIWSRKLYEALWAFRTAYKKPTGTTPYKLIYGKKCHLLFEIEHRAYWELKNCNPDLITAGEKRMFQLHELDKLRHQAYENSRLYKARTKVWHDKKLRMRKEFKHGNKNCPIALKAQFCRPDHGLYPFILLEAIAFQDLWIWHSFFGVSEINNEMNILRQSPIFNELKSRKAVDVPFMVNDETYKRGYF